MKKIASVMVKLPAVVSVLGKSSNLEKLEQERLDSVASLVRKPLGLKRPLLLSLILWSLLS